MGVCGSRRGVRELYQISDQVNPQLVTIRIRMGVVVHMCITAAPGIGNISYGSCAADTAQRSSLELPESQIAHWPHPNGTRHSLTPSAHPHGRTQQEGGLNVHPQPSKMWDFTAPEGTGAAAPWQSKPGVPGAGGLLQARQQKQQMLNTSPFLTSSEPKISAQR